MESTVILNGLIASVSSSLAGVIVRAACVRRDVDILTGRLESIMAVIGDAERHRILAQSEAADHRLKKLREIAYEADTIIDLFRIEVGTSRSQLWRPLSRPLDRDAISAFIADLRSMAVRLSPPPPPPPPEPD
ncbi:hypothetical protein VPH35_089814 [Triticum aestivum]